MTDIDEKYGVSRRDLLRAALAAPLLPLATKLEPVTRGFVYEAGKPETLRPTTFSALSPEQKRMWSRDLWDEVSSSSFKKPRP